MSIHRLKETQRLRDKFDNYIAITTSYQAASMSELPTEATLTEDDWKTVFDIISSYEDLVKRISKNLSNSRKACKDLQKAYNVERHWRSRSVVLEKQNFQAFQEKNEELKLYRQRSYELITRYEKEISELKKIVEDSVLEK